MLRATTSATFAQRVKKKIFQQMQQKPDSLFTSCWSLVNHITKCKLGDKQSFLLAQTNTTEGNLSFKLLSIPFPVRLKFIWYVCICRQSHTEQKSNGIRENRDHIFRAKNKCERQMDILRTIAQHYFFSLDWPGMLICIRMFLIKFSLLIGNHLIL